MQTRLLAQSNIFKKHNIFSHIFIMLLALAVLVKQERRKTAP
jgi:hypothetical protein